MTVCSVVPDWHYFNQNMDTLAPLHRLVAVYITAQLSFCYQLLVFEKATSGGVRM